MSFENPLQGNPLYTPPGEVNPAQSPVVTPVSAPRSSKVTATAKQALPSAAPSAPLPATSSPPKTQSDDVLPFEFTISHENQLVLKSLNPQDTKTMTVAGKKGSNLLQKIDLRYVTLTVPIKDASGKQINAVSFRVHIEDLSKATGLSVPKILAAKMGKGSLKLAVLRNVLGKPELGFAQGLSLVQAARVQHLAQTTLRENANPQVVDLKSLNIKTYQSMIVSPEHGIFLPTPEKIGEGGMKVITGATTLSGQPLVAAKFKKPEENRDLCETVAAFTAQCQAMDLNTSHVLIPHVIRPVTDGKLGDPILVAERKSSEMFRFMAVQWDQGQSITAKSGVSNRDAIQVLRDIADGTAVIHRAGYAHRDLKPENVLLDRTKDGRLRAVVHDLDFLTTGKDTDTPMTCPKDQKSTASGTRDYIPPEFFTPGQYGKKPVGIWLQKHDCFSFGVLACEWLGLQHSPEWNAFYAEIHSDPRSPHAMPSAMVTKHDMQINTLDMNDHLYEAKKLALEMCHPDPNKRPDMADAKQQLEKLLLNVKDSKSAG